MRSVLFHSRRLRCLLGLLGLTGLTFAVVVSCTWPAQAAPANPLAKTSSILLDEDEAEDEWVPASRRIPLAVLLGVILPAEPKRPYGVPTRPWASPITP